MMISLANLTRFPQISSISHRASYAFSKDTQFASQRLAIWSKWLFKYG